jgi:hypothetical protein
MRGSAIGAAKSGAVRFAGGTMAETGQAELSEGSTNGGKASLLAPEAISRGICAAATPVASQANKKTVQKRRFM